MLKLIRYKFDPDSITDSEIKVGIGWVLNNISSLTEKDLNSVPGIDEKYIKMANKMLSGSEFTVQDVYGVNMLILEAIKLHEKYQRLFPFFNRKPMIDKWGRVVELLTLGIKEG